MRVLVCGSRTFDDALPVYSFLQGLLVESKFDLTVIEGGAQGADRLAATWAFWRRDEVLHEQYPAEWDRHGKAAGPIRNRTMLREGKPDLVVAFVDKPLAESHGTNHMVTIAREAGVRVIEVRA